MSQTRTLTCLFIWLSLHTICFGAENHQAVIVAEFVGSTPCDTGPRSFLTGAATNDTCVKITWHLTLSTNENALATYKLVATYGMQAQSQPGFVNEGTTVQLEGTWQIIKGAKSNPDAAVYEIQAEKPRRSLSFIKMGDNLLHLLNDDKSLMVGNDLWSYTLNRKGVGMDH